MDSKYSLFLVVAFAGVVGFAGQSRADVIYTDSFGGTGGLVAGRSPDAQTGLDGGSTGVTWNSDTTTVGNPDADWTATGGTNTGPITAGTTTYLTASTQATLGSMTTGLDQNLITNATLPFVPQTGLVYDLHLAMEVTTVGASGNWLALAYTAGNFNGHSTGGGSSAMSNDLPVGLMITKGTGGVQFFSSGTANGQNATVTAGVYNNYDIFLDTTNTLWTLSWKINGVSVGTPFTYASNPSIGLVAFGTNKLPGVVTDFSLTAVPEPTSLSLLAVGAAGLLARRRK